MNWLDETRRLRKTIRDAEARLRAIDDEVTLSDVEPLLNEDGWKCVSEYHNSWIYKKGDSEVLVPKADRHELRWTPLTVLALADALLDDDWHKRYML